MNFDLSMESKQGMAVCIECGLKSKQQLFRRYTGGAIQLMQCANCQEVIDKYVEFDAVILLLDVLLLRIQSYRHLIFNYDITSSLLWKLSVVLILCESYTKLRRLGLGSSDAVILQVNFHTLFVLSIIETAVFYLLYYAIVWLFSSPSPKHVLRILVISSSSKLSALAAMIWTGDFYLWLPLVLVLPSQYQTLRAALVEVSVWRAGVLVLLLNMATHSVSYLLEQPRTALVLYLTTNDGRHTLTL